MRCLTALYGLLLCYATLYPLTDWTLPTVGVWQSLLAVVGRQHSFTDLLTNILVYIPFGFLLFRSLGSGRRLPRVLFVTSLVGIFLSFSLEILQVYLPGRVPSIHDVALNFAGTFIGALLAIAIRRDGEFGNWIAGLRLRHVVSESSANIALIAAGLWALSQLTPFVPSLDLGNLWNGIKPVWLSLRSTREFNVPQAIAYIFAVTALGMIFHEIIRPPIRQHVFIGFVLTVLLLKIPVVSRQLSLEALAGCGAAILIVFLLRSSSSQTRSTAAALAIISAVLTESLRADPGSPFWQLYAFNWIPFKAHLNQSLVGFADILGGLWPFMALAFVACRLVVYQRRILQTASGVVVFLAVFALEWNQQFIPGRSGDITDVVLAWCAWSIPWYSASLRNNGAG